MKKVFNNILVPVGFNRNTDISISKGVQFANEFQADLHIVHVKMPEIIPYAMDGFYMLPFLPEKTNDVNKKLNEVSSKYLAHLQPGLSVHTFQEKGNWHNALKDYIIRNKIDLVILTKPKKRFTGALLYELNVNRLSKKTGCPVITVTNEFDISHVKNIVVPVNRSVPVRKLMFASYIAQRSGAVVHLLARRKGFLSGRKDAVNYLDKTYKILKENTDIKIHCSTFSDEDVADQTMSYSKLVEADLIVINPGKEATFKGWLNNIFGNYLFSKSNIPVLTVSPIN